MSGRKIELPEAISVVPQRLSCSAAKKLHGNLNLRGVGWQQGPPGPAFHLYPSCCAVINRTQRAKLNSFHYYRVISQIGDRLPCFVDNL